MSLGGGVDVDELVVVLELELELERVIVGGGHDQLLRFSDQPGLGFETGALPLGHVAQVGSVLSVAAAGTVCIMVLGLVGHGVDAHLGQSFLEVRVPVVLDLVVCPFGQMICYR